MESLETTSLPSRTKRLSISSGSGVTSAQTNVLDEILNSSASGFNGLNGELGDGGHGYGGQWGRESTKSRESQVQVQRVTELLQESESSNSLLMEQNRVLKEEIRRLQRSIDRVEVAQNLEYLKNILVKFVTLEGGSSERTQLVPVIKTILKLNPEEESLLSTVASNHPMAGDPSSPSSPSSSSSQSIASNSWAYLWG
jgi:hypothetical protein